MANDRIHLKTGEEIGGRAGATIALTPSTDKRRVSLPVPPEWVIPIIFIPGVMGSHLRMSRKRQSELERDNNRAWRPDEKIDSLSRRGDSPKRRQLNFDPDETEVDRYEITEDAGKFDLMGEATANSDKRHRNVPDGLPDIGLLMSAPLPVAAEQWKAKRGRHEATAAQKARWRGWSEVMFESYGTVIKLLEARMNDLLAPTGDVSLAWKMPLSIPVLGVDPAEWGGAGKPLTEDEIRRVGNCWYPVYAMGYNWLQSNGVSAGKLARRIDEVIAMYQANGRRCEKVIIVTHSMGGLVARAMLNPKYGNGVDKKILGIYHNVQPPVGAAAAYKRVRSGFEDAKGNLVAAIERAVIGKTGKEVTAVFANAPGPLELLPSASYPRGWLRVQTSEYRQVMALPITSDEPLKIYRGEMQLHKTLGTTRPAAPIAVGDPLYDIYAREPDAWWRLLNPEWVNPANKRYEGFNPYRLARKRIAEAQRFHIDIQDLYHPTTYASYGADPSQKAFGTVAYRVNATDLERFGDPLMWKLVSEDGEGRMVVRAQNRHTLQLRLEPPMDAGDQTVPSEASASRVRGTVVFRQSGYEHQNSYNNDKVLASLLYSLVKIANTAPWWKP
ncbi:lipase family alpha/beta hydrolase [Cupriavidus oxalaticus]|uniref:lipase family alpha/beta hydrolase n=1 Tax=Cupriavidus oxalaticus TaxID=96344 RepID=UPI0031784EE0